MAVRFVSSALCQLERGFSRVVLANCNWVSIDRIKYGEEV
jgi:hypothetical protein